MPVGMSAPAGGSFELRVSLGDMDLRDAFHVTLPPRCYEKTLGNLFNEVFPEDPTGRQAMLDSLDVVDEPRPAGDVRRTAEHLRSVAPEILLAAFLWEQWAASRAVPYRGQSSQLSIRRRPSGPWLRGVGHRSGADLRRPGVVRGAGRRHGRASRMVAELDAALLHGQAYVQPGNRTRGRTRPSAAAPSRRNFARTT